jgi:WD40 repeat protein
MHDDFRLFHSFDIKKSAKLKFSQGGHLLVAATDKHVYFISTYGLEILSKLDSPSSLVTCLAFNANDSILSLTSSNGFHQRYDIVNLKKRGEAFIDKSINYRSVVFLEDPADETKCISVGSEEAKSVAVSDNKFAGNLRVFNKKEDIE